MLNIHMYKDTGRRKAQRLTKLKKRQEQILCTYTDENRILCSTKNS